MRFCRKTFDAQDFCDIFIGARKFRSEVKMKLSPAAFLRQLHNGSELPTVVVIVGDEAYYHAKVKQSLLKTIFSGAPEEAWTYTVISENTDLRALDEAINTYPFFSGRSVVLLSDEKFLASAAGGSDAAQKNFNARADKKNPGRTRAAKALAPHEKLLELAENVPEFCTLIIECVKLDGRSKLTKQLQKNYPFVECARLKTSQLEPWLREMAAARGARFEQAALELLQLYLMNVDNPSLSLLEQEIDKLALYAAPRAVWTKEDVENIFAALPEVGRFALMNALAERRLRTVLELLDLEEKKKTYILKLVGGIAYELRRLLQAKECRRLGMSQERAAAELGIAPYIMRRSWSQAEKFEEQELKEALMEVDSLSTEISLGGRGYDRLQEILLKLLS